MVILRLIFNIVNYYIEMLLVGLYEMGMFIFHMATK